LAKDLTPKAMKALEDVLDSESAPPAAKVAAANSVLDRGWGKPAQAVTAEINKMVTIEDMVLASYRHDERQAQAQKQAEEDKLN
jgi:hypothetical protein